MHDLIFAFMPAYGGDENEALLLVRSLRAFGGSLAGNPIWVLIPQRLESLSAPTRQQLAALEARLIPFEVPSKALEFPFGGKVYAAAAAERLAEDQTETLVWMDSDTVFVQEPREFRIPAGIGLGYRPVMLKNISCLYDDPIDHFWDLTYQGCHTPEERIFAMLTIVDEVTIRAQFNAGLLVTRPRRGLLRLWQENFTRMYTDSIFNQFYAQHVLYHIFIHQSILAGTLLTMLSKEEMHDLGPRLNYPIFLHSKTPPHGQAACLNDVVTFRYDEFRYLEEPNWKKLLPIHEPLKSWLDEQVGQIIKDKNVPMK